MTALLVAGLACVAVGLLWGAWEWAVRHAPVDPDEGALLWPADDGPVPEFTDDQRVAFETIRRSMRGRRRLTDETRAAHDAPEAA